MTLDARRKLAADRMLEICPSAFQFTMRPLVEHAMSKASDAEIDSLLCDIDTVREKAESGDRDGISAIAKKYGASESMIDTYLPLLTGSK